MLKKNDRKALELDPGHRGARFKLGSLLHRTGRIAGAPLIAASLAHPDPLAALQRALSELENGELEQARALYWKALRSSQ